jgi:hypothetical protein
MDTEDRVLRFIQAISDPKTKKRFKLIEPFEEYLFQGNESMSSSDVQILFEGEVKANSIGLIIFAGDNPGSKRSAKLALSLSH